MYMYVVFLATCIKVETRGKNCYKHDALLLTNGRIQKSIQSGLTMITELFTQYIYKRNKEGDCERCKYKE